MKPFTDLMLKEKIASAADILRGGIYTRAGALQAEYALSEEPVPFSKRLSLSYKPIREGEQWSHRLWDCAWFHITGEAPAVAEGHAPCLIFDFEGEGCLFSEDGTPVRGLTNVSSDFDRSLGMPGKRVVPFSDGTFRTDKFDLWIETGNNDLCGVPPVVNAHGTQFFAELQKEAEKFPVYRGELYLERHQGTYTSQAKNKYFNRRMENALAQYEFAQVLTDTDEKEATEALWKEVLLYQFHDILPGSSIKRVYDESEARYAAMLAETEEAFRRLLTQKSGTLCAVNATSFGVQSYVKHNGEWYAADAAPWSVSALQKATCEFDVYATENTIGNALVEAEFDANGAVVRLTDKKTGRQSLSAPSGMFRLYHDTGNAWDFYPGYVNTVPETFRLVSVRAFCDGARAGIVQEFAGGRSKITQTVSVLQNSPLVRCDVTVDWNETQKMLRADFYPAVAADEVTCDIQWGNIKRSTRENGSIEYAQFEICAHKWVDVSETEFGFALINDGKYGYRCKNGCVSVDLLRSENYPCVGQDKGMQTFSYALYAHTGDLLHSDVAARAYHFNRPLQIVTAAPCKSFVASSDPHVVAETVKPAEDGKGVIVRLYNDSPYRATTQIDVIGKIVCETDMLENAKEKTDGTLRFHPFEIKTLYCVKG